jgi:hypothetical protein
MMAVCDVIDVAAEFMVESRFGMLEEHLCCTSQHAGPSIKPVEFQPVGC